MYHKLYWFSHVAVKIQLKWCQLFPRPCDSIPLLKYFVVFSIFLIWFAHLTLFEKYIWQVFWPNSRLLHNLSSLGNMCIHHYQKFQTWLHSLFEWIYVCFLFINGQFQLLRYAHRWWWEVRYHIRYIYIIIRYHIRMFLKTEIFLSGLALRPHVSGVFDNGKPRFSKTLSRVEVFKNAVFVFMCGRAKTMM